MEKGVAFGDLEQFVIVPERPRLWDLKNPGWSVNKSKYNRFVITPNGYLLTIFTMLPLLTFGIPLTFFGIVLFGEPTIPVEIAIVQGIIGILLLLLCLLIRRSELCIDLLTLHPGLLRSHNSILGLSGTVTKTSNSSHVRPFSILSIFCTIK